MRQLTGLLKVIDKAHLIAFYDSLLSYATVQGQKLPSLTEFLALSLNQEDQDVSGFDEKTDKELEALALARIAERNLQHGR